MVIGAPRIQCRAVPTVRSPELVIPENMVAPEVHFRGFLPCAAGVVWPLVLSLAINLSTAMSEGSALEAFPGERPPAARMREYMRDNRPKLTSDEVALIAGAQPASLLQYADLSVPPALVADAPNGITPAMVEQRLVSTMRAQDENTQRQAYRQSKRAEIRNGLFAKLEAAMHNTAPLLLEKLKRTHVMAAPRAACCSRLPNSGGDTSLHRSLRRSGEPRTT